MSQDIQFRPLNSMPLGSATTKLITYWEKERTLMYNDNPAIDKRDFRVIFLRSLLRDQAPAVKKGRHYKVYRGEYDRDIVSGDRVMRCLTGLHLGSEVSLRVMKAVCSVLWWGVRVFSHFLMRANELLVPDSSLPLLGLINSLSFPPSFGPFYINVISGREAGEAAL